MAPLRESAPPPPLPPKPIPPSPSPPSSSPSSASLDKNVVTLELQRQVAKELQDYFKQKKMEEANQGPFFGFLGKNEIANGRYMFFSFSIFSAFGFKIFDNLNDPHMSVIAYQCFYKNPKSIGKKKWLIANS